MLKIKAGIDRLTRSSGLLRPPQSSSDLHDTIDHSLRRKKRITGKATARISGELPQTLTWMMIRPGIRLAHTCAQMFDYICWESVSAVSSDLPFEVKACAASELSDWRLRALRLKTPLLSFCLWDDLDRLFISKSKTQYCLQRWLQ